MSQEDMTALQHLGLTIELLQNQLIAAREFYMQAMRDQLALQPGAQPQQRVRFDAPVGTQAERDGDKLWPGAWFDATGYCTQRPNGDYHTGVDLNLPAFADTGEIVRACADGVVVFSGQLSAWGYVVVVQHALEDGVKVWSRYAHLNGNQPMAVKGDVVQRGKYLAVIGDYGKAGPPDDHVHFDLAKIDLGVKPGDWPGPDKARVLHDYYDPMAFIQEHHHV